MNKIVSTKNTNAIFLAMVLITGTIASISPSFIIGVNAQSGQYYEEMDNRYNNYKQQPEYPDREYNSYEPDYGMNSYEKKAYIDDSYETLEYPYYKQDYETKYSSYEKDNNIYKSKKDSGKSVNINKIKCINNNLNINGNNTGDINIGNKGQGYLGGYSSASDRYYDEGYNNKQDKGFECIINNNNNNTTVVIAGGNVTDGNGNVIDACEECFNANATLATIITNLLANTTRSPIPVPVPVGSLVIGINVDTIAELCDFLETQISAGTIPQTSAGISAVISAILASGLHPIVSNASVTALVNCLLDVDFPGGTDNNTAGLAAFDINTGNHASSFSSPPTIAQGTEEDLSALEKIEKLKKQWLELLP